MLCLNDSIRYDDPSVQRLLNAVEETIEGEHREKVMLVPVKPETTTSSSGA